MRNYHVVLADGAERNIKAGSISIENGVLEFWAEVAVEATESAAEPVVAYASGMWKAVEVERKDDKGYPGEANTGRPERPAPLSKR